MTISDMTNTSSHCVSLSFLGMESTESGLAADSSMELHAQGGARQRYLHRRVQRNTARRGVACHSPARLPGAGHDMAGQERRSTNEHETSPVRPVMCPAVPRHHSFRHPISCHNQLLHSSLLHPPNPLTVLPLSVLFHLLSFFCFSLETSCAR